LVIDDIGYVKKTDAETQVLFEFIAHRYDSSVVSSACKLRMEHNLSRLT